MKLNINIITVLLILITSCNTKSPKVFEPINSDVKIFPDYTEVTIPPNIASLNFIVQGEFKRCIVEISDNSGNKICVEAVDGLVTIPKKDWSNITAKNRGGKLKYSVFVNKENKWYKYKEFYQNVAKENIDSHLAYRIIHPGYEMWKEMGIYQRDLEDYNESAIMLNKFTDGNCMNCHSFCNNSPDTMMFHMRAKHGGTYININDVIKKVNTKRKATLSAGAYPSWHPSGKYIAFSTNKVSQTFHAHRDKNVEVFDHKSNIIVYDVRKNSVFSTDSLRTTKYFENYPSWSPCGNYLYYTRAIAKHPSKFERIKYDLMRISFDESKPKKFGEPEKLVSSELLDKSVAFPRVSPDGKYVLLCLSDYGMFTIWHKESDLYLYNIENKTLNPLNNANSDNTDSFHSWSSNSKWIVFSSKRMDDLTARPHFSYIDDYGKDYKAFVMPQKNPEFYNRFLKSYNMPEFIKGRVEKSSKDFVGIK